MGECRARIAKVAAVIRRRRRGRRSGTGGVYHRRLVAEACDIGVNDRMVPPFCGFRSHPSVRSSRIWAGCSGGAVGWGGGSWLLRAQGGLAEEFGFAGGRDGGDVDGERRGCGVGVDEGGGGGEGEVKGVAGGDGAGGVGGEGGGVPVGAEEFEREFGAG